MTPTNSNIWFRLATEADAAQAWSILSRSIEVMRLDGRDQWQDGYPNEEILHSDIANGIGYVLLADSKIVGYCALIETGEPGYDNLDGKWLTQSTSANCRYTVVHRMAIDPDYTGRHYASQWFMLLLDETKKRGLESLRVDTNHDNVQMLALLPRCGFERCGTVIFESGQRIAFEHMV